MRVIINRRLPSQNMWNNKRGIASQFIYKKERDIWYVKLRKALGRRKSAPEHKVNMKIVSHRKRLCDFANLVGGAKPIPDCLIRLGYLYDDAPQYMECTYEQHKCGAGDERTEIVIDDQRAPQSTISQP